MSTAASSSSDLSQLGSYTTLQLSWAAPAVLRVSLCNGKLNTMPRRFWSEMRACFQRIGANAEVRVVLLTAEGKIFSAGLDLADHAESFSPSVDVDVGRRMMALRSFIDGYQQSFTALETIPQPVVVAIQGACIGGGMDLITAGQPALVHARPPDIRLCTADAWFSVKEVDVGMAADVGSLQRLPRVVGSASLVREWCFTGRKVPAAEALSSGLVSRVLPTREALAAEALALCVEIAAKSPLAVSGTKAMLNYSRDHSVRESLDHVAMWNAAALQSQDVMKAMQATTARQTPIFSNL